MSKKHHIEIAASVAFKKEEGKDHEMFVELQSLSSKIFISRHDLHHVKAINFNGTWYTPAEKQWPLNNEYHDIMVGEHGLKSSDIIPDFDSP